MSADTLAPPRPFLDFYGQHGIAPVHQEGELAVHLRRRRALYHMLGIPPTAIRGRRVLEFGPGTGQNAIATIQDRPSLYRLVDGNPASIRATMTSLAAHRHGVDLEVVHEAAEGHRSAGDFDLVIAEGLIPFQLDPQAFVRKLARHVAPGGVLVVTCIDSVQYMGELTRRMIADALTAPTMDTKERVRALLPVFRPHLRALRGMSRNHEDWILDNLLIPHAGRPFSIADAVEALGGSFDVLGCSPRFHGDARWYKTITTPDPGFNRLAVESYQENVLKLLDCRLDHPPRGLTLGGTMIQMADELFRLVMQPGGAGKDDVLRRLDDLIYLMPRLGTAVTLRSLRELRRFLEHPSFSAAETGLPTFAGFFGRGQAYVSFVRR